MIPNDNFSYTEEEQIYYVIWHLYYQEFEDKFFKEYPNEFHSHSLLKWSDAASNEMIMKKTRKWNVFIKQFGLRYTLKKIKIIDEKKYALAKIKFLDMVK
jgi:hypothetical protein